MSHVLSIVGARPQFIKLSPINNALVSGGIEHLIVHTGQHYEAQMSDAFFREFNLPQPFINLGIGGGDHAYQLSNMLTEIDKVISTLNPSIVLVYGDTNSTLAACLSAVRRGVRVAHIESGLRSLDRLMPEEQNRIAVDHLADYLFAPTQNAMNNLATEGLIERSEFVGDVMFDVALNMRTKPIPSDFVNQIELWSRKKPYFLTTIHRASNTISRDRVLEILKALNNLSEQVIFPLHPRMRQALRDFQIEFDFNRIIFVPPQSYLQMSALVHSSNGVITDSGGLQKEAFFAKKLCFTVRNTTEWPETLIHGWNTLVAEIEELSSLVSSISTPKCQESPFGNGDSATQIVKFIESQLNSNI
jgi:UDP-N-acetylglucosamine 2-epimerase (non-hydrolysing)